MLIPRFARILLAILPLALVAQEQSIPAGGTHIVGPSALASAGFWGGSGTVTRQTVTVDGPGFDQAVQLNIIDPAADNWDGQLQINLNSTVLAGDVALLHFWMRVTESDDESGAGSVFAMIEKAGSPFTKSAASTAAASSDWYPFYIPFAFAENYAVGGVQIKYGLGEGKPRTVQIGGVQLFNYGSSRSLDELPETAFTYSGREADAPWRSEAAARIESHRKGDFVLKVFDAEGEPLAAEVALSLARHQFHFASVIDAGTLNGAGTDNEIYRQKMVELFNASGTENDLKWPPLEGDWGTNFNYSRTSTALEWLRLRGFFLRGHVLVWPGASNLPNYINALISAGGSQRASVPGEVLDHITGTVETYAPWIDEWDVINEPYTNTTLMEAFGAENPGLFADWFKQARAATGPGIGLFLNDYAILSGLGQNTAKRAATIATLRDILNRGGPVSGMGFQGHFDESSLTAISQVYAVLEEFATEFPGLRFRITEYDVTTENEPLQADYLRDFLTLVFSHPQVDGFQFWGFWAGRHWRPEGALFREDWTPREQLQAYTDLLAEWHSEFDLATDPSGRAEGRGFKGEYQGQIVTDEGTYELTLPVLRADNVISLELPGPLAITAARALRPPGPGLLAIAFPTNASETYWIETSLDAEAWRAESLPMAGTGNPQVCVIPVPSENTFWRLARGALP